MDPTEAFTKGIRHCRLYDESVAIVRRNSSGGIWLIGGFVYRTIASQWYGTPRPEVDLDFVVEHPVERLTLPDGWTQGKNRFGTAKLTHGKETVDFVPLSAVISIVEQELEPTIENLLAHVPLTVQSIAYDIAAQQVIGETGIASLRDRTVKVNNLRFALVTAEKKGTTLNEMIRQKSEELGFTAVYPA